MVLNYIWVTFFLIAFVVAVYRLVFQGDTAIFQKMVETCFDSSKTAFEICLYMTGTLTLWMGLMRVGEKAGLVRILARLGGPLFSRVFPDIPANHPAMAPILMNFSANLLGLDNAGTPLGLKAMQELQKLNPRKDVASNPQIMFLVINTSGLTLIPITIIMYRAQLHAVHPTDVFIPILLSTMCSTMAGFLLVSIYQKINLLDKVLLSFMAGALLFISLTIYLFRQIPEDQVATVSSVVSNFILFSVIVALISLAVFRRINAYEAFIEGAKEGFDVAIKIIPYLLAMLVGVGVFRASGALDSVVRAVAWTFELAHLDTRFVEALPTALLKPFSGSGARGMMIEAMQTHGPDSFVGRMACTFQGATDTTLYIIAVYFGSVNIRRTRYAIGCGLFADMVGILMGIFMSYIFYN